MDAHGSRRRALSAGPPALVALRGTGGALVLAALVIGCARPEAPVTSAPKVDEALPFIHDDYARALAEAKRSGRPLFVDAWATWCHSCLSMRAFVLSDPALAPLANDFVWLTIDTEKDGNATFVRRFSNRVWPTLWILDAAQESTLLRWEGTATAGELVSLLGTVRAGARAGAFETAVTFLKANQAAARGDSVLAEQGYRAVIAVDDAPDRARAVEALVGLLSADHAPECATLAVRESPLMPPGTSRATVLATGLSCAREANHDEEVRVLLAAAERAAVDPDPRTIADDRSALYEELVETKSKAGDLAGAKATALAWAAFLEHEAAKARTREARAVFDPHRLTAYTEAGEPARALPMLLESERDFPGDYNPPARLARVYLTLARLDQAQAAIERAAALVYGPRALRVFVLAADIAKARGDRAGERSALEQALARTATAVLNESQRKLRAQLEKRQKDLP